MPPSQRITIRVPADLLTTLESHLRPGDALSDIVRRALQDYVSRLSDTGDVQRSDSASDTPPAPDILRLMTQMTHQLDRLGISILRFPSSPRGSRARRVGDCTR
jgi:hypothetical protein